MILPTPKSPSRPAPVQKPVPFERGSKLSIKKIMQEAKKNQVVIPGTGGQKWGKKQFENILKQRLPYRKVGTDLGRSEAIRILRQMRTEDKGTPSRERRTFEEKFRLKSGKDY